MKIMFMITFEYANAIFSIPLTGKRPSSIVFVKMEQLITKLVQL